MPEKDDARGGAQSHLALAMMFFTIGLALALSTTWAVGLPFMVLAVVFFTQADRSGSSE